MAAENNILEITKERHERNMKFESAEQKRNYMLEEPVEKLVCRLAAPTILSMMVTSFYNMADTFFVGKLDTQSTAAVGVVFSLMAIIQAIGFLFGHGSTLLSARFYGNDSTFHCCLSAYYSHGGACHDGISRSQ